MSGSGLFLVALVALVVGVYARRFYMARSIVNYDPVDLAERIEKRHNMVVLDVRSRSEREGNLISGSIHIPLPQLSARVGELERYRGKEIVCYCQSGNRSLAAAFKLHKLGFHAVNLKGGIAEWNFQNRNS